MALGTNGKTATTPVSSEERRTLYDRIVCNPVYQVVSFIPTLGTSPLMCRAARAAGEAYVEYDERQDAEHAAIVAGAQAVEAGHMADIEAYSVGVAAAQTQQARYEVEQQRLAQQAALQAIAPAVVVGGLVTLGFVGYLLWRRRHGADAASYAGSVRPPGPSAPDGYIGDVGEFEGAAYSVRNTRAKPAVTQQLRHIWLKHKDDITLWPFMWEVYPIFWKRKASFYDISEATLHGGAHAVGMDPKNVSDLLMRIYDFKSSFRMPKLTKHGPHEDGYVTYETGLEVPLDVPYVIVEGFVFGERKGQPWYWTVSAAGDGPLSWKNAWKNEGVFAEGHASTSTEALQQAKAALRKLVKG